MISTIVIITVIVHQVLGKITYSHAAMAYSGKSSINAIYGF
jgi:hypothetical protein